MSTIKTSSVTTQVTLYTEINGAIHTHKQILKQDEILVLAYIVLNSIFASEKVTRKWHCLASSCCIWKTSL